MERRKDGTAIWISRQNYDRLVELGDMTKSFDDIVSKCLDKAYPMGASAAKKEAK